jgi:hypothetical protein
MRRSGVLNAASWVVVAVVIARAASELRFQSHLVSAGFGPWGADFHGGAWLAAQQILHGVTPYLAPDPRLLVRFNRAFVTPPAIGLLAVPLAHLPYGLAIAIWNALDAVAMVLALWLLRVRDLRMYLLVLFSAPFVNSITSGQLEGLLALLTAMVWRRRDSWSGALGLGGLIAAKLYAAPMIIWLLVTRRFRVALVAGVSAAAMLATSWAIIGFHGLGQYPSLLGAASSAARNEPFSDSVLTLATRLGVERSLATLLAMVVTLAIVMAILAASRGSDAGWLCATVVAGLFASPILWEHYLVLIFVPLAIAKPRTTVPWLLTGALWIPYAVSPGTTRATLTLLVAAGVAVLATATIEIRAPAVWLRRLPTARRPPTALEH